MASFFPISHVASTAFCTDLQSCAVSVGGPQAGVCARDGRGGARSHSPRQSRMGCGSYFAEAGLRECTWHTRKPSYFQRISCDKCHGSNSFFGAANLFWPVLGLLGNQSVHCRVIALASNGNSNPKQQGPGMPSRKRSLKKPVAPKLGYHPLEDLPTPEKGKGLLPGEGKLSSAEIARTIAEVNMDGIVFASVVRDENAVLGTDASYLVDPNGELYLELDDENEFLQNLQNDQTCSILVGFGKMDDVSLSELIEEVDEGDEERTDGPSNSSTDDEEIITDEDIKLWNEQFPGGISEMLDTVSPEAMGSLGAWGGPQTLKWVHPWEFATRLSEAATSDYGHEMDFPSRRLIITGVVRRATEDEERRVRDLWDDRFADFDSDSEHSFDTDEGGSELLSLDMKSGIAVGKGSRGVVRAGVWLGEPIKSPLKKNGQPEKADSLDGGERESGKGSTNEQDLEGTKAALGKSEDDRLRGDLNEVVNNLRDVESDAERDDLSGYSMRIISEEDVEGNVLNRLDSRGEEDRPVLGGDGDIDLLESGAVELHEGGLEGTLKWSISNRFGAFFADGMQGVEGVIQFGDLGEGAIIDIPSRNGWGGESDWEDGDDDDLEASLYKVEILSIQLDSTSGIQENVEVGAWSASRPDMLAHTAPSIMDRANSLDQARRCMADLCLRERGLVVDEVTMAGIDHLGIDLRIRMGIELSTLRFPFLHPATSERAAEKLLEELLRPRQSQSWRLAKRNRQSKRFKGRYQHM